MPVQVIRRLPETNSSVRAVPRAFRFAAVNRADVAGASVETQVEIP